MFGWFRPKCPVDDDVKRWIEYRFQWLVGQFGPARLRLRPMILPTDQYFPEPYAGSPQDVRRLLDRLCGYMDVDPATVGLSFFGKPPETARRSWLQLSARRWLGFYDEQGDRRTIWLDSSYLADPATVVATLAHELGHVHLLGDHRVTPETSDHEPLADLLTVAFGLGVFTANDVLCDVRHTIGHWSTSSVARQGYLTAPMFGYALALLARFRGEPEPAWAAMLRPDVRWPFRQSRRYLLETRQAEAGGDPARPVEGEIRYPAEALRDSG